MSVRSLLLALALLTAPALAHAQSTLVRGRFVDAESQAPVPNVQVRVSLPTDTALVARAVSGEDGWFSFSVPLHHTYRLQAARLGFEPTRLPVRATSDTVSLGTIRLTPRSLQLPPISVNEAGIPTEQKADTTEYHAGAVRTHRDATAEELVQKLPGVTIEQGQVKAQGETVQQVLVNGRPFFGSDPTAAMRNLPAEVVDRIQVYDRMSDQAEFSGFDDGSAQKTMNFILRDQKLDFGRVSGGFGDQGHYQASGNASRVRGAQRLTLIGMSNDLNERNFSIQDLVGAMSGGGGAGGPRIHIMGGPRPGGGGGTPQIIRMGRGGGFGGGGAFDPGSFLVNQQPGITTTHAGGFNYSGQWGPKLSVTSSVFLNGTDTDNRQTLDRTYIPPQDSLLAYGQTATTTNRGRNQRGDARIEWTPDSLNSVILQPRLYWQQTRATSVGDAFNQSVLGEPLSAATSDTRDRNDADNLSARLTLRHRFAKRGRNVSAELNGGHNLRDGDGTQLSFTDSYTGATVTDTDTLDQRSDTRTLTNSFSARVAYTEPVAPGLQAQAIWNPSLTRSESDARTRALDTASGLYALTDTSLSNSYRNRVGAQNGGLAFLLTRGAWKLLGNGSYQSTRLYSERTWPAGDVIERTYDDVLPSLTLSGSFANRRSVRLAWNTSTTPPTISQLQDVVNNANPLSLSTGNPDLRPTYTHSLSLRLSEADPARSRSRFLFANVSRTAHAIGNATFTAPRDTVLDGVPLARGTQLTRPENLDESWNANLFAVYSRPAAWLKGNVSVNGGGNWSRTPTRLNGVANRTTNQSLRTGLVLASNVSPKLDYTVSYWATWTRSRSTLSSSDAGDYFTHSASARLNATLPHGVVFREELSHQLQTGVPSAYGQDIVLWNSTLAKKFLKGERGELRLTATDVFEQNKAVNRSVTETYVQDTRDRVLGRYVQAVFTYSWR